MHTLDHTLAETGDHATAHPHGGFQVFVTDGSRIAYFRLSDYTVAASLSGPSLHLMPNSNPAAILGEVLSH